MTTTPPLALTLTLTVTVPYQVDFMEHDYDDDSAGSDGNASD